MKPFLFTVYFAVILGVSQGTPMIYDLSEAEDLFINFVEEYNRTYDSPREVLHRFHNFKNNLVEINARNEEQDEPIFGITELADISPEEVQRMMIKPSAMMRQVRQCPLKQAPNVISSETTLDYRAKNAITPVKNQGNYCGSCWAFSVLGVVEAKYAMKYGKHIDLSEQQLVDCDTSNNGCDGGFMDVAMQYTADRGLMLEQDYPYRQYQQRCYYDSNRVAVKVANCERFNMMGNEEALTTLLAEKGPLSFGLSMQTISHYRRGIYKNCPGYTVNHAVVLVGYGTENGTPYWIIKNSWGTSWGEQGYMRLRRGANECNMLGYSFTSAEVA